MKERKMDEQTWKLLKKYRPCDGDVSTIGCSFRYVYVVFRNLDLDEGKGPRVPFAVCWTESCAKEFAKGASVMGTDGTVERQEAFVAYLGQKEDVAFLRNGCAFVVSYTTPAEKKLKEKKLVRNALDKLTEEEIEALGLNAKSLLNRHDKI